MTYTLSCYAKVESGGSVCGVLRLNGDAAGLGSFVNTSNQTSATAVVNLSSSLQNTTEWKRYNCVFTVKSSAPDNPVLVSRFENSNASKLCICGLKLEKGRNENTIWTPNLEDSVIQLEISKVY